MLRAAIAGLTMVLLLIGADQPKAPIAGKPIVNLKGQIARVDAFGRCEGMPAIIVVGDGTSTTVVLGSMRYLMEQNFNPKAGALVEIRGYKLPDIVVAIEVRLPASNVTLNLRDENGWPLWRGNARSAGGCPRCGCRPE